MSPGRTSKPDHEVKDPRDRATRKTPRVRRPRISPEPWERQPGESEKAFKAFQTYRDLAEERSYRRAAKELDISDRTCEYYSARFLWVERALAYDNYIERAKILKRRRDVESMQQRHINTAMLFQQKVVERLRELNPIELSVDQIGKWFELASKIERQSRGEEEAPAVQVNIGQQPATNGLAPISSNALADYLEKHPERIPSIMPLIERFLQGENGALEDIERAVGGSEASPELAGVLASSDAPVRPADLGSGDGEGQPA